MTVAIRRVVAPNPGPLTGPGTNTYIVSSEGDAVILDPGPVIADHRSAILGELATCRPVAVAVTHTHPDHAPAANPLADELGVPAIGFASGPDFEPTRTLRDGDHVAFGFAALEAIHTPGHTPDHLCYRLGDALFTGDHIMSGSTVIIEDLGEYMRSLHRVRTLAPDVLYPGHGEVIEDAIGTIDEYIAHREMRERQVLDAITSGARTVEALLDMVYVGLDPALRPAAALQIRTQLRKLKADGRVRWNPGEAGTQATVLPNGEAGT